jgi:hypothetical protein
MVLQIHPWDLPSPWDNFQIRGSGELVLSFARFYYVFCRLFFLSLLTMIISKSLPSPSVPNAVSPSPSAETSTNQHIGTSVKTPVVISPEMENATPIPNQRGRPPLLKYSMEFHMSNCGSGVGNGAQFLSMFLKALTNMDPDASVLLSNSSSEDRKLDAQSIFPTDSTLKEFVKLYIAGLRLTSKLSMTGKLTIRSRVEHAVMLKNTIMLDFLSGKWSGSSRGTPVKLLLHSLDSTIRHQVGFFFNTCTRSDCLSSLHKKIADWVSDWKGPKAFPTYQVEVHRMYRKKNPGFFFRILSSKADAPIVETAFTQLFPVSSQALAFMPSSTWDKLPCNSKDFYHKLHRQFTADHSYFLFSGVKDSSVKILREEKSTEAVTIINWIKDVTIPGAGKERMFVRVEPHPWSGNVELLAKKKHAATAANWITQALVKIAVCASETSFSKLFRQPATVRELMDSSRNASTQSPASSRPASGHNGSGRNSPARSHATCQDPVVGSFLSFEKSYSLSSQGSTPSARGPSRGRKADRIAFHLDASKTGATSVKDAALPNDSAAADGKSAPHTTRRNRRSKQKPTSSSVHATTVSTTKVDPASIQVAPSELSSTVADAAPICAVVDESTTPSAVSHHSDGSAVSTTSTSNVKTPTPAVGNVNVPSTPKWQTPKSRRKKKKHATSEPPTEPSAPREPNDTSIPAAARTQVRADAADSMASEADDSASTATSGTSASGTQADANTYRLLSEIAALKMEVAALKEVVAKLPSTSNASSSHAPETSGISTPSPLSSNTKALNGASDSAVDAAAAGVTDTDGDTVVSPPRTLHREIVLAHTPPYQHDLLHDTKRSRLQDAFSPSNRFACLTVSDGDDESDDDDEIAFNLTVARVHNLHLESIPRSSNDESGMPL